MKVSEKIKENINSIDLINYKIFDPEYGNLKPVIKITYYREYYILNNIRITFDQNIKYCSYLDKKKHILNDEECVIELKFNLNQDTEFLDEVLHTQISRFSKYCRGINKIKKLGYSFC